MKWKTLWVIAGCIIGILQSANAQTEGIIRGRVNDQQTNEAIPFANVVLQGSTVGTTTDFDGNFELREVPPGLRNIQVSFLGYESKTVFEIEVTPARPAVVNVVLKPSAIEIEEAEVVGSRRPNVAEAPLSVRSLGTNEIKRNPGGGRDISRALRTLPGVAAIPSFRNDIVVRGGAPNENRFYIDGIEIPNINHFATQGASGGPVGMTRDEMPEGNILQGIINPTAVYPQGRAQGGVMDLQDGGESRGPGTGTSDSIPAMLSDGEFVMTAKAVRGAGGGDRREGARKMYEAMDKLEAQA